MNNYDLLSSLLSFLDGYGNSHQGPYANDPDPQKNIGYSEGSAAVISAIRSWAEQEKMK